MNYELNEKIAIVTLDDGKANAVGPKFIDDINDALDRAVKEHAGAVILRGREGIFSAGFDLGEFKKGPEATIAMVARGMQLLIRLYSFPLPLVVACTGHGIAMGAFIMLACDTRIGTRGAFRITLPETAIGMEIPGTMLALAASRIPPHFLTRATIQAEVFNPDQSIDAGFLDEVVEEPALDAHAFAIAQKLAALPQQPYAANKLAARRDALAAMTVEFDKAAAQFS